MEELIQNTIHQDGGIYHIDGIYNLLAVEKYGKTFVIPDGVVYIADYAFWKCEKLEHVVIPDSVRQIGAGAFSCCTSLKEVVIPDGVTCLENDTFTDCRSLEKVTLPASLRLMKKYAFYQCNSLKEIMYHDYCFKVDNILPGVERACQDLCLGYGLQIPLVIDVVLRMYNGANYKGFFNTNVDCEILKGDKNLYF